MRTGFEGHIKGDLLFQGGDIRFESLGSGDNHVFGKFIVDGDVFWEGGTYHPYVNGEVDGGSADEWDVTGLFSISATTPSVAVTAVDAEDNVITPNSNMSWKVIRSADRISAGGDPSLSSGWTFDKDPANVKQWWKVKKS